MSLIQINQITKDYGNHRGTFDVSFTVEKGEILGFLGPNGAGKTTTIRQLMGFIKPDYGTLAILGKDCFKEADLIQKQLGYLPGEIAFMDEMTGTEFIQFIANLKNLHDLSRAHQLIDYFELNCSGRIRRMSKGMKQKIGLVCAFMSNPEILILDEPTSGLDPLMQNKFIDLILEEKKKGTTILMSSHLFEEVERTCDRAVIIKEGKIVAIEEIKKLKKNRQKCFDILFVDEKQAQRFHQHHPEAQRKGCQMILSVTGSPDALLKELAQYSIEDLSIRPKTLEELFMHFYGGETHE